MCQALMEIMKEEVDKRVDSAVATVTEKVTESAAEAANRTAVQNLMETMHLSAEDAMDTLKIPKNMRAILYICGSIKNILVKDNIYYSEGE